MCVFVFVFVCVSGNIQKWLKIYQIFITFQRPNEAQIENDVDRINISPPIKTDRYFQTIRNHFHSLIDNIAMLFTIHSFIYLFICFRGNYRK